MPWQSRHRSNPNFWSCVPGALENPLAVGQLEGQLVDRGLRESQVDLRGAARLDRGRRRLQRVADRAHRDVVCAGLEPVFRKTVLPLRVGADRNHDGRTRALGANHNAFHFSFVRRGHGAGERRRGLSPRRMAGCYRQHTRARECGEGQSLKSISKSGGGHDGTLRWQRSGGLYANSITPGAPRHHLLSLSGSLFFVPGVALPRGTGPPYGTNFASAANTSARGSGSLIVNSFSRVAAMSSALLSSRRSVRPSG